MSDPQTPASAAECRAEQERVLKLLEGITPPPWNSDPDDTYAGNVNCATGELVALEVFTAEDEELISQAPTLARQYAALLDAHAEALEREAGLMAQVQVLSIGPTAEAIQEARDEGAVQAAHLFRQRAEGTMSGQFADPDMHAAELAIGRLREALEWYGEQARLCRKITSEGDAGRQALGADGGKRAWAALSAPPAPSPSPSRAEVEALIAELHREADAEFGEYQLTRGSLFTLQSLNLKREFADRLTRLLAQHPTPPAGAGAEAEGGES